MSAYTEQERKEFLDEWGAHIKHEMAEYGILPLLSIATLQSNPESTKLLELHFGLPVTGDAKLFLSNYRQKYYTKQCLAYLNKNLHLGKCLAGAAKYGHLDVINEAVKRGYDLRKMSIEPALYQAAKGGHIEIIKLLTQKEADSTVSYEWLTKGGYTAEYNLILEGAAQGGHLDIVKWALEKGANAYDYALIDAVDGGHFDIVELLIDKGATGLRPALAHASKNGNNDMVEFLIRKGAYRIN